MKVNLTVEVSDPARRALARALDNRAGRRLATREELRSFVVEIVNSLAGLDCACTSPKTQAADGTLCLSAPPSAGPASDLYRIDDEDRERLRGKPPGFIYGWNKVKRRQERAS
jgi:hypothetical protein